MLSYVSASIFGCPERYETVQLSTQTGTPSNNGAEPKDIPIKRVRTAPPHLVFERDTDRNPKHCPRNLPVRAAQFARFLI